MQDLYVYPVHSKYFFVTWQKVVFFSLKLLSKIVKFFFVCLILTGMMKTTILYSIYEYNRASFIEMFCVNKDRPQLDCNGKCKLAEMQKEQNEKRADDILKQLQLEIVYFSSVKPVNFSNNSLSVLPEKSKLTSYYNLPYSFIYIFKPVKPPETQQA